VAFKASTTQLVLPSEAVFTLDYKCKWPSQQPSKKVSKKIQTHNYSLTAIKISTINLNHFYCATTPMAVRNFFICWVDSTDPTKGLDFFPPKGSDELYEALKEYYPHHKNLQSRMQSAIIDFYVEQQSMDADMTSSLVQSPIELDTMATSPDSTFDSSVSTPMTQSLSSASPALPKQEDLMQVFTLSSHPSAKIHKRRNMTEAEKLAYKQKRVEGACSDCRRRRRKCTHSTEDPSTQSSSRRSTKNAKRKSSSSSSISSISKLTPAMTPTTDFMQIEPMANINFNIAFDHSPVPLFDGQEITFDDDFFQKDFQLFDNSFNVNNFLPQSSHQQQSNSRSSAQNGGYSGFDLESYIDFNGGSDSLTSSFSSRSSLQQSRIDSSTLLTDGLFDSVGGSGYLASPSLSPRDGIPMLSSSRQRQLIPHNSQQQQQQQAQNTFTVGSHAEQHVPAPAVEPTVSRSGVFINNDARLRSRTIAQQSPPASHSSVDYSSERLESQTSSQDVGETASGHDRLQSSVNTARSVTRKVSRTLLTSPQPSLSSSHSVNVPGSRHRTNDAYTTILLSVPTASLTSKLCSIIPSLTETMSSSSTSMVGLGLNGLIQPSPTTYFADSQYNSSSAQNLGVDVFTPVMLLMALFIGSLCGLRVVQDVKATYSTAFGIISLLSVALQSLTYSSLAFSVSTLRQRLTSSAQLWSTVLSEESFSHRRAISFTT
jgi:hypothetical protein